MSGNNTSFGSLGKNVFCDLKFKIFRHDTSESNQHRFSAPARRTRSPRARSRRRSAGLALQLHHDARRHPPSRTPVACDRRASHRRFANGERGAARSPGTCNMVSQVMKQLDLSACWNKAGTSGTRPHAEGTWLRAALRRDATRDATLLVPLLDDTAIRCGNAVSPGHLPTHR